MEQRDRSTGALPAGIRSAGVAEQAREAVSDVTTRARREAASLAGQARVRAENVARGKQAEAADRLDHLARAFLQAAHTLEEDGLPGAGRYASAVASRIENVSRYVRDARLEHVVRDAQSFARRHPGPVLAGAFLAGIALARFAKSTASRPVPLRSPVYDADFAEMSAGS
jgi:hypothetical protein